MTLRGPIYGLVGLLLLLGAAEIAWLVWGPFDLSFASAEEEVEEEGPAKSSFVRIDNLVIPVIRNQRVERHVTLSVALEVSSGASRRVVQAAQPRLRDAFVRDLHAFLRVLRSEGNPRYLVEVKARLMEVSERVVGPGKVRDVLIQQAGERPLI